MNEDNKIKCPYCEKSFLNAKGFSYHLTIIHNMKYQNFLIENLYNGKNPTCKCGCGEEVKFFGGKFMNYIMGHQSIGREVSQSTRDKISTSQIGKKLTDEHKNKISCGVRVRLNIEPEITNKISCALIGKAKTEQHSNNISKARKTKIANGEIIINASKISATITQKYLDGGIQWSRGHYRSKSGKVYYYRSSWELKYMEELDNDDNSNIIFWNYEPFALEYQYKNSIRKYLPDFIVHTNEQKLLVEIKPLNLRNHIINEAKRNAAIQWCRDNGYRYAEKDNKETKIIF